jgi:phosphoglycerate dehydrogenase-like enzyme
MAHEPAISNAQLLELQRKHEVGIIGMGDMGKMYARRLSAAGWRWVW